MRWPFEKCGLDMIVEHRTYSFRPGRLKTWLGKYESEGLPIQKKHLGRFLGLLGRRDRRLGQHGHNVGLREPGRP